MDNLVNPIELNDLILYIDDDSWFLSEIIEIDTSAVHFKYIVNDLMILRNTSQVDQSKAPHILESGYSIAHRDIFRNFGNITLEEFEGQYPEWLL